MLDLFAHAGEEHTSRADAASHSLLETWYYAVPLFLLVIGLIAAVVYYVSGRSKSTTTNAMLLVFFISGVGMYSRSAAVSIIALTAGFALALFQVIIGLSSPAKKPARKK